MVTLTMPRNLPSFRLHFRFVRMEDQVLRLGSMYGIREPHLVNCVLEEPMRQGYMGALVRVVQRAVIGSNVVWRRGLEDTPSC
jgi:hypothetical protein